MIFMSGHLHARVPGAVPLSAAPGAARPGSMFLAFRVCRPSHDGLPGRLVVSPLRLGAVTGSRMTLGRDDGPGVAGHVWRARPGAGMPGVPGRVPRRSRPAPAVPRPGVTAGRGRISGLRIRRSSPALVGLPDRGGDQLWARRVGTLAHSPVLSVDLRWRLRGKGAHHYEAPVHDHLPLP
jgi:hypothetical protein